MRILITSGGTKVPIDSVRHIGNMSSGTFGNKIAVKALKQNMYVDFLYAKGSKNPAEITYNFDTVLEDHIAALIERRKSLNKLTLSSYSTYSEYAVSLRSLLKRNDYDAVILAAAVSDYVVKPIKGKIRSSEQLTINLTPAKKLIGEIRKWGYHNTLVGFKLMVKVSADKLIKTARESCIKNDCDFVVANDLMNIKNGDHSIIIVSKDDDYFVSSENNADAILTRIC